MSEESEILGLSEPSRNAMWTRTQAIIERYINDVAGLPVSPQASDPKYWREYVSAIIFDHPCTPEQALEFAAKGLRSGQVHTPHPRYFGLFNPAPTAMGIAADTLVAAFNPQMAAWSHSPFAAEIEQHLIRSIGGKFGYHKARGTFTTAGAEANLTALLCALTARFPKFAREGVRAIAGRPVLYVSEQAHHSFIKAARCCGLGTDAVRQVAVDQRFRLNCTALEKQLAQDRAAGLVPFLIVATAGTTGTGAIDDLARASQIATREGLWFHVDAAWGGAAALVPELRGYLDGIERADSITFDAHKFLSVPMGAGLFLTAHSSILAETFRISTDYMPPASDDSEALDPYTSSIQWSRRFAGLKLLLSLAVAGWEGYAQVIRHQTAMGDYLRRALQQNDWEIVNDTPLPLVCFRSRRKQDDLPRILDRVLRGGQAWVSSVLLPELALRACITNYRTTEQDVDTLIAALEEARRG